MNNNIVTARDLLRDQRAIIERVKETKEVAIVVTYDEPQVAIVPLEDVEELQRLRRKEAFDNLLNLSKEFEKKYKGKNLPQDLGSSHDKYLIEGWEERKQK